MQRRMVYLAALLAVACETKSSTPTREAPSAAASAPAAEATLVGLRHPKNDPALVALASAAAKCEWDGPVELGRSLKFDCAAHEAWNDSPLTTDPKSAPTLMNLLSDPDPKVRDITADALYRPGHRWMRDKEQAMAMLPFVKNEKHPRVALRMGSLAARISIKKTGLKAEVLAIIDDPKMGKARETAIARALSWNSDQDVVVERIQQLATSKDPKIRDTALRALWSTPEKHAKATCEVWLATASDPDHEVSGQGAYLCAKWPDPTCVNHWGALLDAIEKRHDAGNLKKEGMVNAMAELLKQPKLPKPIKARTMALAGKIAKESKDWGDVVDQLKRIAAGKVK